jgi:hypothetical protein
MKLNFASGALHACRRLCVTALMENEPPRWQVESEERHAAARQERSRAAEINFCHSPECALMNELEKRGTNCVIGALNSEKYKTPLAHKHCPPPPLRCIPALLWSPRATRASSRRHRRCATRPHAFRLLWHRLRPLLRCIIPYYLGCCEPFSLRWSDFATFRQLKCWSCSRYVAHDTAFEMHENFMHFFALKWKFTFHIFQAQFNFLFLPFLPFLHAYIYKAHVMQARQ